jgi:transketolase
LIRCADANEVAAALRIHIDGDGPTGIVLTRQNVPVLEGTAEKAMTGVANGAYVLADGSDVVLIGTGSEVSLCVEARELLAADGVSARVVSMPSWDLFDAAGDDYRVSVLPPTTPTLAIEAGSTFGWSKYADDVIGLDRFGESAPANVVFERLGFTPQHIVERAKALLGA